jgi:Transglutaminase-like superfamily
VKRYTEIRAPEMSENGAPMSAKPPTAAAARTALARHRLRVVEAMLALAAARLMLRILPFTTTMKLVGSGAISDHDDVAAHRTSDPVAAAVGVAVNRAAARLPWRFTCLTRSLAGRLMLMRRGVPSTIVFGVTKQMEHIRAHAWLVVADGFVCGGREAANFQPIAAFQELNSRDV